MELTLVDWNVNGFALRGQAELLRVLSWDVCTLQEVTTESWPVLRELGNTGDVALHHLPPIAGTPPRYYSAILTRAPFVLGGSGCLADVPSPERTLVGTVGHPEARVSVASLALPPGVSWGRAGKSRQAARIAAWLTELPGPGVVGIDANTPKFDRADLEETVWWDDGEAVLLGSAREHGLRDVYRDWLERDPERLASVQHERPDGPLAVSHVRGRGNNSTPCRYDHILASPDFDVLDVTYDFDRAIEAGSDHALVTAHLRLI